MKQVILFVIACCLVTFANAQSKTTTTKTTTHKSSMQMKDCVTMMKDGKMMSMMNGRTMPMDKKMTMKNGATVMTDGTVKWKNGKTTMLKDGDCVYMDGTVHHKMKASMKDM